MFKDFCDSLIGLVTSRLFILGTVILLLFGTLINRLFILQIINGADYQQNFTLKILKEQSVKSTRGKIYDKNGILLAYDELAYSVTIVDNYDSTGAVKNHELNDSIYRLINIIEENGDALSGDFSIMLDDDGNFAYSVEDKVLLRFLADIYGRSKITDLKVKEKTATPYEVIEYLCSQTKFGIGEYIPKPEGGYNFTAMKGYTNEELLKIVTIRYAMSLNSFQKYIATTVAKDISNETVAVVMENKSDLQGVDIFEDTVRRYIEEESLSPILGYTGVISPEELSKYNADGGNYNRNDMVGRAGIELYMEKDLQGQKGLKQVFVDNLGKVIEIYKESDPIAGNDVYLTIDSRLQSAVYKIIEQKLAGIIVSHIRNIKDYNQGDSDASSILIPIDDVYYALFNNSVIDISHFNSKGAARYEKEVYAAFSDKRSRVISAIRDELLSKDTPYENLPKEYKVYESFITSLLSSSNTGILNSDLVDEKNETYIAWKAETISLSAYLKCAVENGWIDVTKLEDLNEYSDVSEVYKALVDKIADLLSDNNAFARKMIKYMIHDDEINPLQICMILFEQGVIRDEMENRQKLITGEITAYNFILNKIRNLEITPAQLALDPCTGSCVVTDVATGEVRACVSYPSYDNNRLANSIDADYYNRLRTNLSNPLYSYATQQKTAPGSTFKMVSSIAGVMEGVVTTGETINCLGKYDKIDNPKCWKYPSSHGNLNISGAIQNSCNFYFYEVGYRLGLDGLGHYKSEKGLKTLGDYADKFGLSETSGIEITEADPTLSNEDSVRSAIGQGTFSFTTVQLARYITCVANEGTCFNISLLDKTCDASGKTITDFVPKVRNKVTAPDYVWDSIHQGMRGVVTSSSAFKNSNIDAAGKTGTAQQIRSRPNHALFVGYAPYYSPEISIATRIAYGYSSSNAAEVSKEVFQYYFGAEDESELLTGTAHIPVGNTISD